jgi:syntaxin-binding protein 1
VSCGSLIRTAREKLKGSTWLSVGNREQLARLSVHVEIASSLNKIIDSRRLVDLGKLEQDLVFGDATSKEVINFLSTFPDLAPEDKVSRAPASLSFVPPERMLPFNFF